MPYFRSPTTKQAQSQCPWNVNCVIVIESVESGIIVKCRLRAMRISTSCRKLFGTYFKPGFDTDLKFWSYYKLELQRPQRLYRTLRQADEKLSTAGKSLKYVNSDASVLRILTDFQTFRHDEIEKLSEKTTEQKQYLKVVTEEKDYFSK